MVDNSGIQTEPIIQLNIKKKEKIIFEKNKEKNKKYWNPNKEGEN